MEKPNFIKQREWVNTGTPDGEIKVFYPTLEDMANFAKYVEHIERQNAHLSSGICKVVPPKGWHPRPSSLPRDYSDIDDFIIECPVKERIESTAAGCYVKNNTVYRKEMQVRDFKQMALSKQYRTPTKDDDLIDLERYFWRNLLHHEPIYAADTPGTLYEKDVKEFNINNLGTIMDLLKELGVTIKGVNTVFLYFGMWKTMFPWHVEDMDLYSINYMHFGEPKFWYAIPPAAAEKFERLAAQRFQDGLQICKAFLRHKLYIISPTVLRANGIPFGTMVQYPGEFIITFPKGYHMGFNVGYNCAESTNFALERWIDYGKNTVLCYCRKDTVEIDMRPFMKKYRPEEYREWFEYWYGERPTTYKPQKMDGASVAVRKRRKGNKETKSSNTNSVSSAQSEASSEGSSSTASLPLPKSICTKRQKKIFKARKPMNDLWSNRPVNLFAEKAHNEKCGRQYPHCCVCQYFLAREIWSAGPPVEKIPPSSRRYVTDQMFHKDQKLEGMDWSIRDDELLQCSNCLMVVHRNCYPCGNKSGTPVNSEEIVSPASNPDENIAAGPWLCERCNDRSDIMIRSTSCKLCELRGGALVGTQQNSTAGGNDFVHVICALIDRNTHFLEPRNRRAPFSPPPRKLIPPPTNCSDSGIGIQSSDHDYAKADATLTDSAGNLSKAEYSDESSLCMLMNEGCSYRISPTVSKAAGSERDDKKGKISAGPSTSFKLNNSTCSSPTYNCKELVVSSRRSPTTSNSSCTNAQQQPYPASYQCEVCGQQADADVLIRCDLCLAMDDLGAKLRFHITCAPLADVTFERRNFPECAIAVCSFHSSDQALMETEFFKQNQRVILHIEEENFIAKGRIIDIREHLFSTVDFLDGTVSTDIFPCDIRDCECQHFGCTNRTHIPGSLVYVDWNDDKIYTAYYRGKTPKRSYKVRLFPQYVRNARDDVVEVDSESIYGENDRLPEDVRLALLKRNST